MKRIYLTSRGLDVRYKDSAKSYSKIIELLKEKNVAIIPNAKSEAQNRKSSSIVIQELNNNKIKGKIFDLNECLPQSLYEYDALYFTGGSPKNLMKSIHSNKFFEKINEFIEDNNIVIGQSAGAMIMNKEYYDVENETLLIQDNGFDFFDKMIVPHYNNLSDNLKSQMSKNIFNINDDDDDLYDI